MNRLGQGISIIVSAYKVQAYIEDCLLSILKQQYNPIEVLIGVDACPDTLNKLRQIIHNYKAINPTVVYFKKNVGTYIVSNTLVEMAKYNNILRFDSDDIMGADMIKTILSVDDKYNVIRFKFYNFYDNHIANKKLYHAYADGCAFYTRLVFILAGGYSPWECGADTEFMNRIKPIKCEYGIAEPQFLRRKHSQCLTENTKTGRGTEIRKQRFAQVNENYDNGILQIKLTTSKNYKIMFDLKHYWDNRYKTGGNSGAGSYNEEARIKASYINLLIKNIGIQTIQEYGMGDGNNLSLYTGFKQYTGYDIAPTAVELCKLNPRIDHTKCRFTSDKKAIDKNADLALSLDVLLHQVEDRDYYEYMDMVFKANHSYILLFTPSREASPKSAQHVRYRQVIEDVERLYPHYKLVDKVDAKISEEKYFLLYKL